MPRSIPGGALRTAVGLMLACAALTAVHAQEMPAMPVSVAQPVKRQVVDWAEFSGRFEASALVDLRARVSGQLDEVNFRDGAVVEKGDLLFTIDPRPYEAALRQAEANVRVAQTRVDLTASNLQRAEELRTTGNIPESILQQRQQESLEAIASLEAAKATAEAARLDLDFTQVKAPISGRIGRKLVTEGNYVTGGSATGTLLTTIVQYDPAHFYFDLDEQSFQKYQRAVASGERERAGQTALIALSDETDFTHEAKLDFIGNQIDEATGTIRVRAVLPNPNNFVTPGLFGRVRIATGKPYETLVLPDVAIVADQDRKLVMTVTEDGSVAPKPVTIGPRVGPVRVIRSGLDGNEKVIINGLMRARPGSKVQPQPTEFDVPEDLTRPVGNAG
ncbi:MexE family multidrug efflux RND transporter periplasmic adaptor subunit [Agaricicola taiwanensis]|uniref:MexE family multidrug efflux RND transporter periplasmic adaptor subunit n=1 Tax=Agaricicola taiwanensis TaxID=591372 RepID=A0A8J2VL92_9RHOB|nr:efflux RND transporter periplasmic adaptor subunit [Agaricicola taiwanensis]GGE29611.1 MexE family multidrug efflux RND transporter periplasmic adaptor subunit [Agaricicola taiwanensis]